MTTFQVLACALLATAGVYALGLQGGFVFDDYANIVENHFLHVHSLAPADLLAAAQSGMAGPTMRPLSMVSFALNHYFGGLSPFGYKLVNLVIHGANGVLVYALMSAVLAAPAFAQARCGAQRRAIAVAVAGVWLVHPLHASTVLFVVQRMNLLAALFTFAGVLAYLRGRVQLEQGRSGFARGMLGMLACTGLATLCKENGALTPLLAAVCEVCVFRCGAVAGGVRRTVDRAFCVVLALPLVAVSAFLLTHLDWLPDIYAIRPFTLGDRLLTEARALWFYLGLLFVPDYRRYGLFHDDFAVSGGWFYPMTGAIAVAAWLAVALCALGARRRAPIVAFAVSWFLAGHALESGPLPLEPVFEHRNYVPALGPLALFMVTLWHLAARFGQARLPAITATGFAVVCAVVTGIRADHWSDPVTHALSEVQYHPRSYRVTYELGRIYYGLYEREPRREYLERSREYFRTAARLDSWSPLPHFALIQVAYKLQTEPDPAVLAGVRFRLANWPLHPNVVTGFKTIVDCQAQGRCRLAVDTVLDLFGVALANPTMGSEVRPFLLTQLASYYAAALADPGSAIDLVREIRREYPQESTHAFNLIRLLIAVGRLPEARAEADAARSILLREKNLLKRATAARELAALEHSIGNGARE